MSGFDSRKDTRRFPKGYRRIALTTAAVGILPVPPGANYVVIIAEGGAVRWRDDGVAPTAPDGIPLFADTGMIYWESMETVQFAAESTATLHLSFYA